MGNCSVPGCAGDEAIAFTCNECGDTFCSEHRLPEAHGCPALASDSVGDKPLDGGLTGDTPPATSSRPSGPSAARTRGARDWEADRAQSGSQDHRSWGLKSANRARSDPARWATVLYRIGVALVAFVLVAVLLIGFTPLTTPSGLPQEVADPIQGAADASSGFIENLTRDASGPTERSGTTTPSPNDSAQAIDRVELERLVHETVNERRQSRGLDALESDEDLREIARYHSRDMAQEGYFAHTSPDGETVPDRYDRFGYRCRTPMGDGRYATGGENIYMTSFSGVDRSEEEIAADVVTGWMNSPGHRENLLREYWQAEGIGVYAIESDGGMRVYVTQNFC